MDQSNYIKEFTPFALEAEQKYGVPHLVALAQGAIESGYAKKAPGNMVFGIKAGSSWKGDKQLLTTTEYSTNSKLQFPVIINIEPVSGGRYKYTVKDYFRAYPTYRESFLDYAKFLKDNPRYGKAFSYTNNPEQFIREVAKAGYATASNYADSVLAVMNSIKKKYLL